MKAKRETHILHAYANATTWASENGTNEIVYDLKRVSSRKL
jgi:hypothetical protein